MKNYRDAVDRARDYAALVERHGGRTRELLWAIGEYDIVAVAEAVTLSTALSTTAGRGCQVNSPGSRSMSLRAPCRGRQVHPHRPARAPIAPGDSPANRRGSGTSRT